MTSLHGVGRGVSDLLIGFLGKNYQLKVKRLKVKLPESQIEWIRDWRGRMFIVRSVDDTLVGCPVYR